MYNKKPWLKFYGDAPQSIDYPRVTMYDALMQTVKKYPKRIAYDFLDNKSTYRKFAQDINTCAGALASLGLKSGDRVTIAMPTTPQGLICFYAVNKLGAVASMIHPLSTAREIAFYLNISKSRYGLVLEEHYDKFKEVKEETSLETLILTGISDCLPGSDVRPLPPEHSDPMVRQWKTLMAGSYSPPPKSSMGPDELAVILYSGGTTGLPKGIMLSNYNFISEGMMAATFRMATHGGLPMVMLAGLPIFHGFGLGICCNAMFMTGGTSILIPQFTPDIAAELIKTKRPTSITGWPVAQIPFAKIIKSGYKNSNTFLERNRHDGLPT
jgi:long-chain acyl-CoA synthetase